MSAAMLGAQAKSPEGAGKAPGSGNGTAASTGAVTFTGCVAPGSNSDSFYLTNAKQKGVKGAATTVKVVPASKKVDLGAFVTQGAEVTGTLDRAGTSTASAGSESAPTLTVTKIKSSASANGCESR